MRILLFTLLSLCFAAVGQADVRWRTSLTQAYQDAKAERRPILLHFYGPNCPACGTVLLDARVGEAIENNFVPLKVDAQAAPAIVEAFGVQQFPTDVIVTAEGQVLSHGPTPRSPQAYVEMLRRPWVEAGQLPASPQAPTNPAQASEPVQAGARIPPAAQPGPPAPQGAAYQAPGYQTPSYQSASSQAAISPSVPSRAQLGGYAMPRQGSFSAAPVNVRGASQATPAQTTTMPVADTSQPAAARLETQAAPQAPAQTTAAAAQSTSVNGGVGRKAPMLDGFCPVTMVIEEDWVPGNPEFGVVHLGEVYFFASAAARDKFMESPARFTPVLNGLDVVKFLDERKIVQGVRDFGYVDPIYNRVFLFSSEESAKRFYADFQRYAPQAIKIMEKAISDANPSR